MSKGALALGRFGVKAIAAARGNERRAREFEKRFELMAELEPPDPAFFDVPTEEKTVSVELNAGADVTLERI